MPTLRDLSDGKERMPIEVILSSPSGNHREEEIMKMLEGFEEYLTQNEITANFLEEQRRERSDRLQHGLNEEDSEEDEESSEYCGCSCDYQDSLSSENDHEISSSGLSRRLCLPGSDCECVSDFGNFYQWKQGKTLPATATSKSAVIALDSIPSSHILFECNAACKCQRKGESTETLDFRARKRRRWEGEENDASQLEDEEMQVVSREEEDSEIIFCGNQVVRSGTKCSLEVRPTTNRGLGLFTRDFLPKGTFVCEYAGEVIGKSEADRRWALQRQARDSESSIIARDSSEIRKARFEGDNYILTLREFSSDGRCLQTSIDPKRRGNVARFANHFCPPLTNLVILPIRCDSLIEKDLPSPPRAALFTSKDVESGSELGFDYGSAESKTKLESASPSDSRDKLIELLSSCNCGSSACRKWLPFESSLSVT